MENIDVKECATEQMFSEKDLISFGLFLLSEDRKKLLKKHPDFSSESFKERKRKVYDADLANWQHTL
jgi:hypothetical protein